MGLLEWGGAPKSARRGDRRKLRCPPKAGPVCRTLALRRGESGPGGEAMRILEAAFPETIDRERGFWGDLLQINETLVLEMNGEAVGASSVRPPHLIDGRRVAWIDLFAVDPGSRRLGLGNVLLEESERAAREAGAKKARLFAQARNTGAVSLYSKAGWQVVDHTEWGYADGHRITLEKVL